MNVNYKIVTVLGLALALGACSMTEGSSMSSSGEQATYANVGAKGEDSDTTPDAPEASNEVAVSSGSRDDKDDYDAWDDPSSQARADLKSDLAAGRHPDPKNEAYDGWKGSTVERSRAKFN